MTEPPVVSAPRACGARGLSARGTFALAALLDTGRAGAQQPILQVEGDFYPKAGVAQSLVGPVTEAKVVVARGQVIVPLLIRGERTLFVPAVSGSRVGVTVSRRTRHKMSRSSSYTISTSTWCGSVHRPSDGG